MAKLTNFKSGAIRDTSLNCECGQCGKRFHLKPCAIKRGRGKFCSKLCFNTFRNKHIDLICPVCSVSYSRKRTDVLRNRANTCSKQCMWKGVRKQFHPNWRGGITDKIMQIRNSPEMAEWRLKVYMRDDFRCMDCGEKDKRLNADHIYPFAYFPRLRFDINNGQTLCVECHKKTSTYGKKAKVFAKQIYAI